jgi:hypothetical protein
LQTVKDARMPQVFNAKSNVLARATFLIAGLLLLVIILAGMYMTPYTHRTGIALDQPAPFSHKHHAKELGIDCRYCHTGVEEAPYAGIPATEVCMTCHSQIWTNSPLLLPVQESYLKNIPLRWNKVNKVPDFVYFDHSIHIARGVSCFTCHGDVTEMNLTFKTHAFEMLYCLDCHRNPEEFLRPTDEVFNAKYEPPANQKDLGRQLMEKHAINTKQIEDCWVCHR